MIFDKFFRPESFRQVKRAIQTNKQLKVVVNLIWATICLFLNFEREPSKDNLMEMKQDERSCTSKKQS
jgi:hypothetical protein